MEAKIEEPITPQAFKVINQDSDFEKWYNKSLIVTGFPSAKECCDGKLKDFEVFINVSDEHYLEYNFWLQEHKKIVLWFPMGEITKDIGLVSLFGALQTLYHCFKLNKKVLVHCHAGYNRSQVTRDCFHYLMTNTHTKRKLPELHINGLETDPRYESMNMLQFNCDNNHLPKIKLIENWLKACKEAFDHPEKFIGGMYDWTLMESEIFVWRSKKK